MTAAPSKIKVQALFCPNCGGQIELRGFANTLTAVCVHCATVLDTSTAAITIIRTFEDRQIRKPKIPLGTRGKFDNTTYEVIGFQVRGTTEGRETWEWSEYVLFNPYHGFRYLTEYDGHWNFVRPVYSLPQRERRGLRPYAIWNGRAYRHFQYASARTIFVLGEFPWRVQVDEPVGVDDFTAPPYMLSAETTGSEVTWSEGEYMEGRRVWDALGLKALPPPARGIYINQPSPYKGTTGDLLRLCGLFELALFALMIFFGIFSRNQIVLQEAHNFAASSGEASFVTPIFELKGRTSNVQIRTETDLDNHWMYFNYALINSDTGHAFDFGREVSYYHGYDSDGSWTEGGRNDTVKIPAVPDGHYYLRVEPEAEPNSPPVSYTIVVRRDVPSYGYFVLAALLIPIPAIVVSWRRYKFEYRRWQESDYAMKGTGSD